MSFTQAWCLSISLADRPIIFTPRAAKSGERRATSPSSVVQTGVKSSTNEGKVTEPAMERKALPGWEKRTACVHEIDGERQRYLRDLHDVINIPMSPRSNRGT